MISKENIVLIGFMAAGKSTVGKELASKLGLNFIDTDKEIEKKLGISIPEIFKKYGEPFFRKIESEIIYTASNQKGCVISTGGGAFINQNNRENLKKTGIVIWLSVSIQTVLQRIKNLNNRPLLYNKGIDKINNMLKEREKYYKTADFTVKTDGLSVSDIVDIIIEYICRKNGIKNNG
ncbi:MAG: shikimate kinase [Thermosediminibacterales bacterium]|nr:shikimate kinase [Thermosediminibacterales bacterium]